MKNKMYRCDICNSVCRLAPGIGHYCPNLDCEVGDGPQISPVKEWDHRYND